MPDPGYYPGSGSILLHICRYFLKTTYMYYLVSLRTNIDIVITSFIIIRYINTFIDFYFGTLIASENNSYFYSVGNSQNN